MKRGVKRIYKLEDWKRCCYYNFIILLYHVILLLCLCTCICVCMKVEEGNIRGMNGTSKGNGQQERSGQDRKKKSFYV